MNHRFLSLGFEPPAADLTQGLAWLEQLLKYFFGKARANRRAHGSVGMARLTPSGPPDSPIARLVVERGATMPRGNLLDRVRSSTLPPAKGPPVEQVLDELREERL